MARPDLGVPGWVLLAAGAAALLALGLPPAPIPLAALGGLCLAALALGLLPADAAGSRAAAGAGALFGGLHALLVLHWLPAAGHPFLGAAGLPAALGGWSLHAAVAAAVGWGVHRTGVRGGAPFPLAFALGWAVLEWLPGALPVVGVPWLGVAAALVDHPRLLVPAGWVGAAGIGAIAAGGAAGLVRPGARGWAFPLLAAVVFAAGAGRAGVVAAGTDAGEGPGGETGPRVVEILLAELPLAPGRVADPEARADAAIRAVRGLPLGGPEAAGAAGEVWPESPVPGPAAPEGAAARYRAAVEARAREADRPVLFGAHVEVDGRLQNAVLLAAAGGAETRAAGAHGPPALVHGKRRLVPGVERSVLFGAGGPGRGLAPGSPRPAFAFAGVPAGALVCFEVLFPAEAARLRRGGARLLVQVTNDAPLQGGAGPFPVVMDAARRQHVAVLRLRAAELRVPAVRSALGGRAGAWDALGRAVPEAGRVEAAGSAFVRVRVPSAGRPPPAAWAVPAVGPGAALALLGLLLFAGRRGAPVRERESG